MNNKQIAIVVAGVTVFASLIIRRIVKDKNKNKAIVLAKTTLEQDVQQVNDRQKNLAQYYFDIAYDDVRQVGEYNTSWVGKFGDLDRIFAATSGVVVVPGHQMKMIDPEGRRIIVTGTPLGLAVIRQKTVVANGDFDVFLSDGLIEAAIPGTVSLISEKVSTILGHTEPPVPNIGQWIVTLLEAVEANNK